MSTGRFARVFIATLLSAVGVTAGCAKSPSGPTPPGALTVTAVFPHSGLTVQTVRVAGTGFLQGATLMLGGVVVPITSVNSTLITATTLVHAAGTVDVVVTNPGGQSGTLAGGYTFDVVFLTTSSSVATAGGQLSVSWAAPAGRPILDWIALLNVGEPSTNYANRWWEYTNGATSGTLTLSAPTQPGEYEFRYLLDDGFIDVARSSSVTVSAAASP